MRYKIELSSQELAELNAHLRGPEYLSCLHDIAQEFRKKAKYEDGATTWDAVYERLWAIFRGASIDPFDE